MRYLKNHLSLILALVVILSTLWTNYIMYLMVDKYEINLANNYVILTAFSEPANIEEMKASIPIIDRVVPINSTKIVNSYKNILNIKESKQLLKLLPHFYKLYLIKYPTPKEIKSIINKIKKLHNIVKVEGFNKTHNALYEMLLMIKKVISIFTIFLIIISFLILKKEVSLWKFEHMDRLNVMSLLGAGNWMRFSSLLKMTYIDTLIAILITSTIFLVVEYSEIKERIFNLLDLHVLIFNPVYVIISTIIGLAISTVISLSIMNSSSR